MILEKKCTLWFFFFFFLFHSCNLAFYNPFTSTYISDVNQVITPVISPAGGTYNSDQSVTITCPTSGAMIYYTKDGSDPDGDSIIYSSPISVAGCDTNMTIKAIAIKDGMIDSTISTESYLIQEDYTLESLEEFGSSLTFSPAMT